MPVETIHGRYFNPPVITDTLWRFMNVNRFEDMLSESKLYFRRITEFPGDPWEGYFPQSIYDLTAADLKAVGNSEEAIACYFNFLNSYNLTTRHSLFATCFYNSPAEPEHMWKLYFGEDHGDCVCFQTSLVSLSKALQQSREGIHLASVHYHTKGDLVIPGEIFADYKTVSIGLIKRAAFAHEKEVRLVFADQHFRGSGIQEIIDISEMLERVVISPHSTNKQANRIKDLVAMHCPDVPVVDSDLKLQPDKALYIGPDNNTVGLGLQKAEKNRSKVRVRLRRGKVQTLNGSFEFSCHTYYEGVPECMWIDGVRRSGFYKLVRDDGNGIIFNAFETLDYEEL